MRLIEFCEEIKKEMELTFDENTNVCIEKVIKNNGVILNSITICKQGESVSPNIYMDDLFWEYQNGKSLECVVKEMLAIYEESRLKREINMKFFTDYETLKQHMAYKVINYEKNKELLLKVPHAAFLDLAIVFYCCVPDDELSNATILIYNNHLEIWKISMEQLYKDAKKNTEKLLPPLLVPIEEMMRDIFTDNEERMEVCEHTPLEMEENMFCIGKNQMFVLGNKNRLFGAAAILYENLLENFSERLAKNIFILPSSVHEVILLPDEENQDEEELWKMVCEINETQVEPEEFLADSVYYFSLKEKKIKKIK